MTKEEAEKRIQELLAEVKSLADEHKIEFSFMGATVKYWRDVYKYDEATDTEDYVREASKEGLLLSDYEWESSSCYGPKDRWLYGD